MKRSIIGMVCAVVALVACSRGVPEGFTAADVRDAVEATLTAWPTATLGPTGTPDGPGVLFDDFDYSGSDDPELVARGWTPRSYAGGPGIPGATWSPESVAFLDDPEQAGNRLMQLTSATDGTPKGTQQAELYHQRKFYEGTYASRVWFSDEPISGSDGDNVVQTFFTITPLNYDMEPDYGEIDFEYLPNGGWGLAHNTFWLTTWETYQADPWQAVNTSKKFPISFAGWHTLVAHVHGVRVRYYIDGVMLAEHGDVFYPETPMSINFNQWFIDGGLNGESDLRQYVEQADWVFYAQDEVLTPDEVEAKVEAYRAEEVSHVDTVPDWVAPVVKIPPTPTPSVLGPRPYEASIPHVSGITIDGVLGEWPADAPTFTINERGQLAYVAPDAEWEGPEDLSALVWVGWSEDGLYLAAKVTDDQIVQAETGLLIWQGDYLEMQLDTAFEADFNDIKMSDDDFQLGFSPGDFGKVLPSTFVWKGPDAEAFASAIEQAEAQTEDGYIIEVFIPGEMMPALELVADGVLGLNINPSDSDGPPQEVMMSTSPIRQLDNPSTLGKMILLAP